MTETNDSVQEHNRAVVRRIYLEVLNGPAFHLAPEVFAPDLIDHRESPGAATGYENVLEGARLLRLAFPDLTFVINNMAAEDDLVFVRWTMRGTHYGPLGDRQPTGHAIAWQGITQFRLEDGVVVERWLYADDAGLLEQLDGE